MGMIRNEQIRGTVPRTEKQPLCLFLWLMKNIQMIFSVTFIFLLCDRNKNLGKNTHADDVQSPYSKWER